MSDLVHFNPVRAWDRNGVAAPGALAKFYEPGTTTPRVVYSDADLTVPHGAAGAALKADGRGVFAPVFTSGPIKVVITDAAGVTLPGGTLDPAPTISSDSAGAGSVSFTPTGNIPVANVQDAIEAVDQNWRDQLAALGLGITGTAPLLGNFDATNIPSGAVFRWVLGETLGTPAPDWSGSEGGVFVFWRRNANAGVAFAAANVGGNLWARPISSNTWGSWYRVNARTAAQALWNAGTDTTEATITPAKLRATLDSYGLPPPLFTDEATTWYTTRVTFTHGLGRRPRLVQWYLECTTADNGYAVGDRLTLGAGESYGDGGRGIYAWANDTQVSVYSDLINYRSKTGTTGGSIGTPANWKIVAEVW